MVQTLTIEYLIRAVIWKGLDIGISQDLEQVLDLSPHVTGKASLIFTITAGSSMTFSLEALMPDDTYQEVWSSTRSATGSLVLDVVDLATVRAFTNKVKLKVVTDGTTTGQFLFEIKLD